MSQKSDPILDDEEEFLDDDFRDSSSTGGHSSGHDDSVLVTREGLKKLQTELEFLKTTKRKEVAERLKEAISYGDLSENSEYEEAKNEQAFIEGRIMELEYKIKNAKIIKGHHGKSVQIGSMVSIKKSGSTDAETYTIVGTTEVDPFENRISNESPIGKAVMEREIGDKIRVETPGGVIKYDIVDLK